MTGWLVLAAAVLVAVGAARWLASGRWRRDDDEQHRHVPVWLVPVVVALGGTLAVPFWASRPVLLQVTYALALVWAVVLVVTDLEVRRLPDALTLPAYGVAGVLLALDAVATRDATPLLRAVAWAGGAVLVYLVIALVAAGSGGLGLGDVKLAGVLGLLLGHVASGNALMGLLGGFVLGGLAAGVLLVVRRVDRRSHIPFGPAMLASAYLWCLLPALLL